MKYQVSYHRSGYLIAAKSVITLDMDDMERDKIYSQEEQSSHCFRRLMFGLKTVTLLS